MLIIEQKIKALGALLQKLFTFQWLSQLLDLKKCICEYKNNIGIQKSILNSNSKVRKCTKIILTWNSNFAIYFLFSELNEFSPNDEL